MEREIQIDIPEKQAKVLDKLRNPLPRKKIVESCKSLGLGVVSGGREGLYLVNPFTEERFPIGAKGKGKDASPGMRNAARKFAERVVITQLTTVGA